MDLYPGSLGMKSSNDAWSILVRKRATRSCKAYVWEYPREPDMEACAPKGLKSFRTLRKINIKCFFKLKYKMERRCQTALYCVLF